jgi:hypothetical protein
VRNFEAGKNPGLLVFALLAAVLCDLCVKTLTAKAANESQSTQRSCKDPAKIANRALQGVPEKKVTYLPGYEGKLHTLGRLVTLVTRIML